MNLARTRILPPCTCRAATRLNNRRALYLDSYSAPLPTPPPLEPSAKGKGIDRWPGWTAVVGLELHVQLKGNVKLLSAARAKYDALPNTHVAPFDAALPGSLPRLGKEPVRLALLTCLALGSNVNQASKFDRKHYFYTDQPAGFQVTQKYSPIATGGSVSIRHEDGDGQSRTFDVRIDQIQLEQDTAKSFHDPSTGMTLVDLNRAGAALVEIVTKPDMSTPEEAAAFVRSLQSILRHVGASDANMEKGELRCDINVSVHKSGASVPMGARCEVKNLNGVRFLVGAINSEIDRQITLIESGGVVQQATRGFDAVSGETFHLRSKEDAPDYRYMPDPELGAIIISDAQLAAARASLPELPAQAFDRLQSQYDLNSREAAILVSLGEGMDDTRPGSADVGVNYFELVAAGRDPKTAANWVINELLGQLAKVQLTLATSPIDPSQFGFLIDAVTTQKLTGTTAKSILSAFLSLSPSANPTTLRALIDEQISSTPSSDAIRETCLEVIRDLPVEARKVRAGQGKVLMRLVGEVMKRAGGKADAKLVAKTLKEALGAEEKN